MAIKTRIIRIGNSRGVRIPKPLLEQSGITEDVELEIKGNTIIIQAATSSRVGWDEAFAKMARHGDDALLDPDTALPDWDEQEWRW